MPFFWNVIAKQGQVYGSRAKGSVASVTNGHNFSYPGYNETLCGYADPRIDSNDKRPNPNVTVFEWLHRKPAFQGRVTAVGCWDVFPFIFNTERCGFYVNAGYDPLVDGKSTAAARIVEHPQTGNAAQMGCRTVRLNHLLQRDGATQTASTPAGVHIA